MFSRSCGRRQPGDANTPACLVGALAVLLVPGCGEHPGEASEDRPAPLVSEAPRALRASAPTSHAVVLEWQAAGDPVDGYTISRDGRSIGVSSSDRFLDRSADAGEHRYAIAGRTLDALEGIDRSSALASVEITVPAAATLAALGGGTALSIDGAFDVPPVVTLDARGRLAVAGLLDEGFVVERLDDDGHTLERRDFPGLDSATLLAGADVWYVVGDTDDARPVLGIDPDTLATRWSFDSSTLALTGGCRFPALLFDGALSCRGFADDTLRVGANGGAGATAPAVRIPSGDRLSADDGTVLVDIWSLPPDAAPDAFFPAYEWVSRDIQTGAALDRGRLFDQDPAIDFPFTIDALGVRNGQLVVAGDVLAHGCLRVCVESLAIPPHVDGHFVARMDVDNGRIEAIRRLPYGEPLGAGFTRLENDTLAFSATDRLSVLDIDTLEVLARRITGGEPLALASNAQLTRVAGEGESGVRWFRFER